MGKNNKQIKGKQAVVLVAVVLTLCLLAGLLYLADAGFGDRAGGKPDLSYNLGNPAMISILYHGDGAKISRREKGFTQILDALEETLRQTSQFADAVTLDFPNGMINRYMDSHNSTRMLEIIYDQPFQLSFIENRTVLGFYIDLEGALLLIPREDNSYQLAAYPLDGCEKLSSIYLSLACELFEAHLGVNADPDAGRITGYVMAETETEILVTNCSDSNAYWVTIPEGMEAPPTRGRQVEIIVDQVTANPIPLEAPGKATAARITILELPDYPGARLTEEQVVRAALDALPVRDQLTLWALYWLSFDSAKRRWTVTFNSQWTGELDLAIDDVTAQVSVRNVNISEYDLTLNGSFLFGESGDKIKKLFGAPLSRVVKGMDRNVHDQDSFLLWEAWVYRDIEFTLFSVRKAGEPAPENPDRLHEIKLTSPGYASARGVKVGDSLEQVYEKYGERGRIYENTLTYGDPCYVQFVLDRGTVKKIQLGFYFN